MALSSIANQTEIKHPMFSVLDSKGETYERPFISVNPSVAIRDFTTAVLDPSSNLNKHSADFSLWHVGYWNYTTGLPEPATKTCIAEAIQIRTHYDNQVPLQGGE